MDSDLETATAAIEPSGRATFFTIFVPLAVLYLVTATWTTPYGVDPLTNVLAARELGTGGGVLLESYEAIADPALQGRASWVVPARDGVASQYPPGAAVLAAPLYAVWPGSDSIYRNSIDGLAYEVEVPPLQPAAITTALAAAAGVAFMGLALRGLLTGTDAVRAALVLGLATGVWSVAADKLWLHTADVLYLGLAIWLSATAFVGSGISFGLAAITRPHTAAIAAGVGLGRALDATRWRPAILIGLGTGVGLVGLLVYNWAVFGTASISASYSIGAFDFVTEPRVNFVSNVWGSLFDWKRGLFVYSPFLVVLLPGIGPAWKSAPQWVRGAAAGGLLYMILQLAVNRFSGGAGFLGYRYPIELIVSATPLLALAYTEWVAKRPFAQKIFVVALIVSVLIHGFGQDYCLRFGCRV